MPSVHQEPSKSNGGAGLFIDPELVGVTKKLRTMANLIEISGIPKSVEEDSGRSAPELANSSALQFSGMLLCLRRQTKETLKSPGKQLRQSMILELFTSLDRDLKAALLPEKIEMRLKTALLTKIH